MSIALPGSSLDASTAIAGTGGSTSFTSAGVWAGINARGAGAAASRGRCATPSMPLPPMRIGLPGRERFGASSATGTVGPGAGCGAWIAVKNSRTLKIAACTLIESPVPSACDGRWSSCANPMALRRRGARSGSASGVRQPGQTFFSASATQPRSISPSRQSPRNRVYCASRGSVAEAFVDLPEQVEASHLRVHAEDPLLARLQAL